MQRRTLIKIAVVLIAGVIVFLVIRPRGSPLLEPIDPDRVALLEDRLAPKRTREYLTHDVPLWKDRSYHTYQFVHKLAGLHFVALARNESRPYVIRVTSPTTVHTLANRLDLRDVERWTLLPDTVLVDDVYAPRRMDALLSLELAPGLFAVRSPEGGPSKPVFFDPKNVEVVQR